MHALNRFVPTAVNSTTSAYDTVTLQNTNLLLKPRSHDIFYYTMLTLYNNLCKELCKNVSKKVSQSQLGLSPINMSFWNMA